MATEMKLLEARIERLEDIEAIRELRMLYHHYNNEGTYHRLEELYTDDAYIDFQPLGDARGRKAVGELLVGLTNTVVFIKQFISSHMVKVDGDTATGISWLDARYSQDGKSIIAAVKYDDKYRRTPQGWKFSEMLVKIYFSVPVQQGWAAPPDKLHHFREGSPTSPTKVPGK